MLTERELQRFQSMFSVACETFHYRRHSLTDDHSALTELAALAATSSSVLIQQTRNN